MTMLEVGSSYIASALRFQRTCGDHATNCTPASVFVFAVYMIHILFLCTSCLGDKVGSRSFVVGVRRSVAKCGIREGAMKSSRASHVRTACLSTYTIMVLKHKSGPVSVIELNSRVGLTLVLQWFSAAAGSVRLGRSGCFHNSNKPRHTIRSPYQIA
jgi:hypothetical protein